jgi:hypothetical protein
MPRDDDNRARTNACLSRNVARGVSLVLEWLLMHRIDRTDMRTSH